MSANPPPASARYARLLEATGTPAAFAQEVTRHEPAELRWVFAPHLGLLSRYLVALSQRVFDHLIVTMPPRHGKSTLISQYFPAWYLGTYPHHRVILSSYGGEFAAEWGGKARAVLAEHGPTYFGVWPHKRGADHNWRLEHRKEFSMRTAGVGGTITGKGAELLIADDLVKNSEEAESPVYREKTYDWFKRTFYTRREPGAVNVVIGTRWHEDDVIGRLLADAEAGRGPKWVVLNLPAVCEQDEAPYPVSMGRRAGDALWPARYPSPALAEIEAFQGPRGWAALYQQHPAPVGSGLFDPADFRYVDTPPPCLAYYRYWDLASTEDYGGRDPDWTVGVLAGKDHHDRTFVLDVQRFRGHPAEVEKRVRAVANLDGKTVRVRVEQEGGSAGKIAAHYYATKILQGFAFSFETKHVNKTLNAEPLAGQVKHGTVYLVRAPWNLAFVNELAAFPNGAHDDQVDAAAGAYNALFPRTTSQGATAGARALPPGGPNHQRLPADVPLAMPEARLAAELQRQREELARVRRVT